MQLLQKFSIYKRLHLRVGTDTFKIDEGLIEEFEEFCYLGSMVTSDGSAERDIKNRICKTQAAFN